MSSESEEYYSDEEPEIISGTSSSIGNSNGSRSVASLTANSTSIKSDATNLTIEDSDADDDDDADGTSLRRPQFRRRRGRAAILSDSEDEEEENAEEADEDDDEDELEQRALSPRTRMSITGVRPADMSDGSSDLEFSNDDEQQSSSLKKEVPEEEAAVIAGAQSPRYTSQFASSIVESLHSTIFPIAEPEEQQHQLSNESSSSDVIICSNRETPIEILSSSEDETSYTNNKENKSNRIYSPRSSSEAPSRNRSSSKLVQPTIMAAMKKSSPGRRSGVNGQSVSQDFYDKESLKLSEMRSHLNEALGLHDKVSHKLPDKGAQMLKRIEGLRLDIDIKSKYIAGLNVQKDIPPVKLPSQKITAKQESDEFGWDQLSAAVNQIKPTHTGARGMATFNAMRALTVDSLKDLHGSLKGCPAEDVLADDPAGLKVQLMNHQKHALVWMFWREQQRPRGGILADDMGLGKTLTMISLVLACKNRQESDADAKSASSDDEPDTDKQRKSVGGWSSKGRKETYKGGTLVICPASLLRQWEAEVASKLTRHRLTVCVHHGNNRETKAKHLRTYDMVVTTYNIVAREQKMMGALFGVKWHRIILDEAHVVRNHKSQSSMAVSEMRAKFRWALTGTPIQNKELDVYALLKFLRCTPFDDLATWKRWIDNKSAGGQERLNLLMKSLMLRRTKAQLQLDGKLSSLPNKEIRLIEMNLDKDEMNVYSKVMAFSQTLFAQFLFQRAEKDSDAHFVNDACKPTHNQIKDPNGAYYKMHEKFSRMAGHNKEVKSHEILVLLLRLRQICCHPGLIDSMLEEEGSTSIGHDESDGYTHEIDLLDQLNKMTINDSASSSSSRRSSNGNSRGSGGNDDVRLAKASKNVLKRSNPVFNLCRPSTKMLKVLEILKTNILKSDDKVIIVSQWTSMLDILRDLLQQEKLAALSLNGSIPVKNRQNIVNEFNDARNSKRILLLSLTAGGVGLNLIGANHLILLDLHWNPQLEAQAQDRIYRVGQKKDVFIYKIVCLETVEQRIKALQDRKMALAEGVLTGKVSSKLSIDDLKGLFGM
ncbi:transcription termination factor 2 [Drosophila grimshawi]|uniref:Transcription termination factor 2 n=1 Tax=Drosophila grimshawi TaxID=7222 RepID=B4JSR7_DROGR|nr:transcription termination factor 2 [Drosophila grimshawi]EDV94807.1 GH17632 [Drosophila grimshawi]